MFVLKHLTAWRRAMHCASLECVLLFMKQLLRVRFFFLAVHCRLLLSSDQALQAVHAAGLQHGDLHSGNILYDQLTDSIYLADFGLCRSAMCDTRCTGTTGALRYYAIYV